jgi:predicted carbohydrate-binding protein with CBM5 and CBM33 domain
MSGGTGGSGSGDSIVGQNPITGSTSTFNQHDTQIDQIMGEKRFHFVAKIVKVYNRNSLTKPCTIDVQPVVKMVDGAGKATSHGTIYGIPVPRNQSGDSVVVNDPQVGDVANFSVLDRDHSSSQANDWKEANPGSQRRSNMADAVFHSVLPREAQEVKQFIRFDDGDGGLTIQDRNGNKLVSNKADGWNLNGVKIDKNGKLTAPSDIVAGQGTADQVSLQAHIHGTGPAPTPGT